MIYSLEEIQEIAAPIFNKYEIKAAGVFGSYARNEATDSSDVDFWIDSENSKIVSMLDKIAFRVELEKALDKEVDVILESSLIHRRNRQRNPFFEERVREDLKVIYGGKRKVFVD